MKNKTIALLLVVLVLTLAQSCTKKKSTDRSEEQKKTLQMEVENRRKAGSLFESTRKDILEDLDLLKSQFSESMGQASKAGQNQTLTKSSLENEAELGKSVSHLEKQSLIFMDSVKKFRGSTETAAASDLLSVTVNFKIANLSATNLEGQIMAFQGVLIANKGLDATVTEAQLTEVSEPLNSALNSLANLKKDLNFMLKSTVSGQSKP